MHASMQAPVLETDEVIQFHRPDVDSLVVLRVAHSETDTQMSIIECEVHVFFVAPVGDEGVRNGLQIKALYGQRCGCRFENQPIEGRANWRLSLLHYTLRV